MTRDEFRQAVLERDNFKCVICGLPAEDAHHIMERRLFPDYGYHLDNGASLCRTCHIKAEQTLISTDEIRSACGIKDLVLPPHLYKDEEYDKWGNPILPNGMRMRGELFDDISVQKILKEGNVLGLFTKYVKYPRTYHLPWSPGVGKDDRVMTDISSFEGSDVVVTVKMDGECTSMYRDCIHARSLDYKSHVSRDWVKALHGQKSMDIPKGWRVCGENLYAKHSIYYKNLRSYFLLFSIWNEKNECLSWEDTVEWCSLLGFERVPVIYEGVWDEAILRGLYEPTYNGDECEGYVVRVKGKFHYRDYSKFVGKYVRESHISTETHWRHRPISVNKLKV